jgi:catechol 2,3-dioxygenase-like lactoylglutathione lyase family enzyme
MIGHVTIGGSDLHKAKVFYLELLAELGAKLNIDMNRIAFIGTEDGATMLSLCLPYNGESPLPSKGNMIALTPGSKEAVNSLYKRLLI